MEPAKAKSKFDSEADDEWKRWRINKNGYGFRNKNCGWIKYTTQNNVVYKNKYSATIKQLCKF